MNKMLKCMLYESYGTTIDQTFLSFVLQRQDVGEGQPIALGALRSGGSSRDITHRNTSQLTPKSIEYHDQRVKGKMSSWRKVTK
jgi:hypothetical protein